MNVMSQGSHTMTKYDRNDVLHCIVAGPGERVTLVSPYQRPAVEPGRARKFKDQNGQERDASIPSTFSFRDIVAEQVSTNDRDLQYMKPIHVDMNPGDCLHIPSFWWYQIRPAMLERRPPPPG